MKINSFTVDSMIDNLYKDGYDSSEVDSALNSLLSKGLLEEFVLDGEVHYRLTDMGAAVAHHMESDPATRN